MCWNGTVMSAPGISLMTLMTTMLELIGGSTRGVFDRRRSQIRDYHNRTTHIHSVVQSKYNIHLDQKQSANRHDKLTQVIFANAA